MYEIKAENKHANKKLDYIWIAKNHNQLVIDRFLSYHWKQPTVVFRMTGAIHKNKKHEDIWYMQCTRGHKN